MRGLRSIWQRVSPCVLAAVQAPNVLVPSAPEGQSDRVQKWTQEYKTIQAVQQELRRLRPELAFIKQPEMNQNDAILLPANINLADLQTGASAMRCVHHSVLCLALSPHHIVEVSLNSHL